MSAAPSLVDSEQYATLYALIADHTPTMPRSIQGRLAEVDRMERALVELKLRLIDDALAYGLTWANIGACLGVTAQAASQLYKRAKRKGLGW